MNKETHFIVFFDGVCNLCNSSVDFIMKHDKNKMFKYASLQSEFAKNHLKLTNQMDFDSIVLYSPDGKIYDRSSAALKITKHLGFPTNLLFLFIIIPKPIRDIVYNFIAKNRYRWFGKKETCRIPTPEERALFVE